MATQPSDLPEREQRLGEVVFACLQAAEQGQPLNLPEVLARHPELAGELREFFADQDQFQRLAAPLRKAAQAEQTLGRGPTLDVPGQDGPPPPGAGAALFGDYELLEEIGSGGNGVVYKARQV